MNFSRSAAGGTCGGSIITGAGPLVTVRLVEALYDWRIKALLGILSLLDAV